MIVTDSRGKPLMRRVAIFLSLLCGFAASACATEPALPAAIRARIDALRRQPLGAIAVGDGTHGDSTLAARVARFYVLRSDAPLWQMPQRLRALKTALDGMADDGLVANDYGADRLAQDALWLQHAAPEAVQARADLDVRATAAYLLALHQLHSGVVDVGALYPDWKPAPTQADAIDELQRAAQEVVEDRIAFAFAAARPASPVYVALRAAMRELREQAAAGSWLPPLPPGPTLKPGMRDARVALLRQRLQHAGELPVETSPDADWYDEALAQAVRSYQARHQLQADGAVGATTLAMLNLPVAARIEKLRINLERARWFLHDLPPRYVLIDIANYRLSYVDSGNPPWNASVQVGRSERPTPVLRSQITRITLDPSWVVPPTILRQDLLPRLRRDPAYLARSRLRAFDAAGRVVDTATINWAHPPGDLTLRQDPGPDGALGVVAFRFPNMHQVYLHDTPHQALFASTPRAFSSGCVRVEHALDLARLLLNEPAQWNAEALRAAADAGVTRSVPLDSPVLLQMIYWTIRVQQDGRVDLVADVYHRDGALLETLTHALTQQRRAFGTD